MTRRGERECPDTLHRQKRRLRLCELPPSFPQSPLRLLLVLLVDEDVIRIPRRRSEDGHLCGLERPRQLVKDPGKAEVERSCNDEGAPRTRYLVRSVKGLLGRWSAGRQRGLSADERGETHGRGVDLVVKLGGQDDRLLRWRPSEGDERWCFCSVFVAR